MKRNSPFAEDLLRAINRALQGNRNSEALEALDQWEWENQIDHHSEDDPDADEPCSILDTPLRHELVEVVFVPTLLHKTMDYADVEIERPNPRVNNCIPPGPALAAYFRMINVHPREVYSATDFVVSPPWSSAGDTPPLRSDIEMAEKLRAFVADFGEVDPTRPPLVSAHIAKVILENSAFGGLPCIATRLPFGSLVQADSPIFQPEGGTIILDGTHQVGIVDPMNGSGHMETADLQQIELPSGSGFWRISECLGHTPGAIFGFVGRAYTGELRLGRQPEIEEELTSSMGMG